MGLLPLRHGSVAEEVLGTSASRKATSGLEWHVWHAFGLSHGVP